MADAISSEVDCAAGELSNYMLRLPWAASSCSSSAGTVGRVIEGVKRLSRMLVRIRARLDDVEEMDARDEFIRLWQREQEAVACAAEDLLDDFIYEVRAWGYSAGSPEIFAFLDDVKQRAEDISSRFDEIARDKAPLLFEVDCGHNTPVKMSVRQPTTSLIEKSTISGRENDLAKVKEFLLDAEESGEYNRITAIAIVGMGGLGKTTLAQLAYNDDAVREHFGSRMWVCVSENFDLVRLTRAMIESYTQEACDLRELEPLQKKLREAMVEKKFLLVLDDVWEQKHLLHYWEILLLPFLSCSGGSKIMITTRSGKVSRITRATSTYHLPCLQYEDCLKLFNQQAFGGLDSDSHATLMAIGKEISRKCKGVPLVAKTLGGLLHGKEDEEMWTGILHSDIWDINEENAIMPILRLSYQHLPVHLKRCFRYCSVFPKDHEFSKDRLVRMWMAHGYIRTKEKKLMEDIGNEYFDDLLSKSFFQYSQKPNIFLMHDLIHDLARCVSEGECYCAEGDKLYSIQGHVRHISIVSNGEPTSIMSILGNKYDSETPQSFLILSSFNDRVYHMTILDVLFTRMRHLRLLDLSYIQLEDLPNSIGSLKHLRYLALQANRIRRLPELIGNLYHLQTLDIGFSSFDCLPDSFSNLVNLRHLICSNDVEYPKGIKTLTNLQTMTCFAVSLNHRHAKLGELKDINGIRSLHISRIDNLTDVNEAKKACLEKKELLCTLDLTWTSMSDRSSTVDDEVLESLRPNIKLKQLNISGFRGQSFPSWFGHPSFSKLDTIKLIKCEHCSSLPALGQLPALRCLFISAAKQVEYIGPEFFCGGFPRLERLELRHMDNWKLLWGAQKGECKQLQVLIIENCQHLTSLSVVNLDALQSLTINGCPELRFSSCSLQLWQLPSMQDIQIENICGARHIRGVFFCDQLLKTPFLTLENVLQSDEFSLHLQQPPMQDNFSNEEKLPMQDNSSQEEKQPMQDILTTTVWLPEHTCTNVHRRRISHEAPFLELNDVGQFEAWAAAVCASHIRLLTVNRSAVNLTSLFLNSQRLGCHHLSGSFRLLEILNLDHVSRWEMWSGVKKGECPLLREITICHCNHLVSFSVINLDALQHLKIEDCYELQFSSDSLQLGQLSSLRNICIKGIKGAKYIGRFFFNGGFQSLERLELKRVSKWETWSGAAEGECCGLRKLTIAQCRSLTSLSLGNMSALEHLNIFECNQLLFSNETWFPLKLQILHIEACSSLTIWCRHHRQRILHIQRLEIEGIDEHVVIKNVSSVQEAQEATDAYFAALDRVWTSELAWDCGIGLDYATDVLEVLENLRLHDTLRELVIRGYMGSRLATWLGDHIFLSHLIYMTLIGCTQCELLPALGKLPHLKVLYIGGMHSLRCLGNEFFHGGCTTNGGPAFPSLTMLELNDMSNLEEWVEIEDGCLPFLCELILSRCPMLKVLPLLPPSLEQLEVTNCEEITFPHSFKHLTSLHTLRISQLPILEKLPNLPFCLTKLTVQNLPALADLGVPPSLKDLVLEGCSEAMVFASLPQLTHLTSLRISDFPELATLPLHNLVILRELHVSNCVKLGSLDCFIFWPALREYTEGLQALKSLELLSISNCPKLHFFANERPPSTLQSMDITNCPLIASWHDKQLRKRKHSA